MEYFAKFTRHIAKPLKPPSPGATQLAKFEKAWKSAQSICYYQSKWRDMPVEQTPMPAQLGVMFDLLVQEDIRQSDTDDSTTGACMEYLLGNTILDELVRLAESDQPVGVRRVIISNLTTFVSLTDDKLLVQKAVHNPILDILRSYSHHDPTADASVTQSAASIVSAQQRLYDDEFVDLLYAICSKIRGEPMLLNIFFHDSKWLKSVEQRSFSTESIAAMMRSVESLRSESGAHSTTYEFLLFSHLLHFVHREGKAGDTARTSLLFLLELATTEIMASTGSNTALERFILDDSGFAAILSATLCALYSQLPRSLQVTTGPAAVIPESFPSYSADLQNAIESSIFSSTGANGGAEKWTDGQGPVKSNNPEFRVCLSSFASLLGFIQDVLFRCPSSYVCDQLLRSLRDNFLQSILYPSLLESSDTDGSSVAVMRYLETILQVVRHEDLVSVFMDFLTDETSAGDTHSSAGVGRTLSVARDGQQAPEMESNSSQSSPSCLPFTLRDLVYTNLQSSVSMDAVVSALNLLRIVLSKHCRYSSRLVEMERVQPSGMNNSWMPNCTVAIDVHRQELDMYAKLMVQLQSDSSNPGQGYGGSSNGGGARRNGAESDNAAFVIPWRHDTPSTPSSLQFGDRARSDYRAAIVEAFSVGYDEYLEDAALDWDSHESYHAEIDALFAAQAARTASIGEKLLPANIPAKKAATPGAPGAVSPFSPGKQLKMRPRKYSEAVMMPPEPNMSAKQTDLTVRDATVPQVSGRHDRRHHSKQCKHIRYNIKPSDPVVRALMSLLARYFAQPRECNLALTGVLAALVGCPYRSLDMWLGFNIAGLLGGALSKPWNAWMDNLRSISDSEHGEDSSDSEGEDDPCGSKGLGRGPATAIAAVDASKYVGLDNELQEAIRSLPKGTTPPSLYLVVSGLAQQSKVLRNEIPDFSRRLKRARNALMGIVEDVEDLDEEFESASNRSERSTRPKETKARDRGLSSASLESNRGSSSVSGYRISNVAGDKPLSPMAASFSDRRNRSTSVSASSNRQQIPRYTPLDDTSHMEEGGLHPKTTTPFGSTRNRAGSAGHTSELASISSTSTGARDKPGSVAGMSSISAAAASGESTLSGTAALHALSVPPANANIAEFLENVIILQESIKEIIARVQVRRENGGDENTVI
ncbi:hypothetical protein IW140_003340 [Coemansia sp. RSA 1813]|nr:hypothetical protein EV178_001835 [Coemansia sp. RSA 1646]KAJ1768518.1 hypothetical protein LPJ74_004838 [Coemansia sp. RSA 1843]KAJ2093012.1 hypothetical protein IW138_000726 [Coemansia sp. RSA 986]KAJ2214080.1 hypothetical protein EV179_003324 [Coemansia sp. RSA 487]KAJ2569120.1 hypothetical protein IW140_003340 [Coemansia sp. RSA 1813]